MFIHKLLFCQHNALLTYCIILCWLFKMELPVQLAAIVSVLIVFNELNWPNVESSSVAVLLFILFEQHKQNLHVNMCAVATVC